MMSPPLSSTGMEAERMLLEPAGDWYGKMPTNAVPLTEEWCRAQIAAGTITPPAGERPTTTPWIGLAWILLILAAIAPWVLMPWGR